MTQKKEIIDQLIKDIESKLALEKNLARKIIEVKMNKYVEELRKDEIVEISDKFEVTLRNKNTNFAEPRSQGKSNVLALFFTTALVDFCKEREGSDEDQYLLKGTKAPLVLDSPFSHLDDEYKIICGKIVSETVEQVIIISSSDKILPVKNTLSSSIGSEYIMINHETKGDGNLDTVMINDKAYNLTKFSQDKEKTAIERIL